jgi:hypothetical protein
VPPAVALLNYTSCGILWRIFCQTGIFAGFSLHIINFAVRISAAAMAGDIIFFSLAGPLGDYTWAHTVSIYTYECIFKSKPKDFLHFFIWLKKIGELEKKMDIIRPWQPEFGSEEKPFVCENFVGVFTVSLILPEGSAKLRWVSGGHLFFRVPRRSFKVRRSSVGCSVARKGVA